MQHSASPCAILTTRHSPRAVFFIHTRSSALTITYSNFKTFSRPNFVPIPNLMSAKCKHFEVQTKLALKILQMHPHFYLIYFYTQQNWFKKNVNSCNIVVQEQFHFTCLYRFFIATAITALCCWFYGVSQISCPIYPFANIRRLPYISICKYTSLALYIYKILNR